MRSVLRHLPNSNGCASWMKSKRNRKHRLRHLGRRRDRDAHEEVRYGNCWPSRQIYRLCGTQDAHHVVAEHDNIPTHRQVAARTHRETARRAAGPLRQQPMRGKITLAGREAGEYRKIQPLAGFYGDRDHTCTKRSR
jgi:hypothetical protein